MEKSELNRDIKRLRDNIKSGKIDPASEEARTEYKRLYGASDELKYMNRDSIVIMIVLNRKFLYIPLHQFGPLNY